MRYPDNGFLHQIIDRQDEEFSHGFDCYAVELILSLDQPGHYAFSDFEYRFQDLFDLYYFYLAFIVYQKIEKLFIDFLNELIDHEENGLLFLLILLDLRKGIFELHFYQVIQKVQIVRKIIKNLKIFYHLLVIDAQLAAKKGFCPIIPWLIVGLIKLL